MICCALCVVNDAVLSTYKFSQRVDLMGGVLPTKAGVVQNNLLKKSMTCTGAHSCYSNQICWLWYDQFTLRIPSLKDFTQRCFLSIFTLQIGSTFLWIYHSEFLPTETKGKKEKCLATWVQVICWANYFTSPYVKLTLIIAHILQFHSLVILYTHIYT